MHIRDHHQRTIDRLADAYRDDPCFVGLIIGGSVAKGCARDDSDVDFLIIATDEVFEQRRRARDLFINRRDLCDYDGGYVDGKIVNLAYLRTLAEKGNEPSRAAFEGAFAAFSQVPDLEALLQSIPVYPEAGHDQRIKAYYSMAFIQHWLIQEAERHANRYTTIRAASQLALFAGRLILAHNPAWQMGGGSGLYPAWLGQVAGAGFVDLESFSFDLDVPYSHVAWRGRIRASAGVGASLPAAQVEVFDADLATLLARDFAGEPLAVPHRVWAVIARRARP